MANSYEDFDWITGFLKSSVESIPEVIGITPSTETLNWRQDNPVSGVVSEFVGAAVPYGGWALGAWKIPKAAKAISRIGDMAKAPASTLVKRELATFAPFEALRLGASQVVGDNSFSAEATNSIVNLALGAGISSLVGGVIAAGVRDPAKETLFPGIDIAAPWALQARHMKGLIDGGTVTPERMPKALQEYKHALSEARTQELSPKLKYIEAINETHPGVKGLDSQLNRWFRPTTLPATKSLQVRAFAGASDKNFPPSAWPMEADLAGVGKDDWAFGQYFRQIAFNPTKPGNFPAIVDNRITKSMDSIGDNWFMAREADDGMFVMAKKYTGAPGKAEPTDRWLMFKTDTPGHWVPDNQRWADSVVGLQRWDPVAKAQTDGGQILNTVRGWKKEVPFRNYRGVMSNTRLANLAIDKMGPVGSSEVTNRMKEWFRELFTTRSHQFSKTPRANYISIGSKIAREKVEDIVNQLMNGTAQLDQAKSLFWPSINRIDGPEVGVPPLRPAFDPVSEKEFQEVVFPNFIRPNKSIEDATAAYQAGELSEAGLNAIKANKGIDDVSTSNVNKIETAIGKKPTEWLPNHYGWSHVWEGDARIPIINEKGQEVHISAGKNKRAAEADADEVLAANPGWKKGEAYSRSAALDAMEVGGRVSPTQLSPSFLLERQGMNGYKWYKTSPTKDEYLKDIENGLRNRWRYQANLAVNEEFANDLSLLMRENPAAYKQVVQRMDADVGVQGEWSRKINRAVDRHLAPMIGNESASRIVALTNSALYNFQLGAMNFSYPATQLTTFIQTTLPEVAMVLGGLPEANAPFYSIFLSGGAHAVPTGFLHPIKLAFQGLKAMKNPTPDMLEAFQWAYNNRTLEPRLHEEYIGEATTKIKDIYKVVAGQKPVKDFSFTGWVRALSEWMPANSERLSRTHTFAMGYIAARDLLRKNGRSLSKEQQWDFAKQFTEKTMYQYSAADRPRVFTGPVGSGLGLFKNWMFNYMGAMGQYSQEAFLRNHWAPLAWQTSGTFALGGLAATPIYQVANQFSQAFGNNDALQMAYDEFGDDGAWFDPADGIMYGFPAMLTGASLYTQVQAPGANPTRDAVSLFNAVIVDRMKATGQAFGGAWNHWKATGEHPTMDPGVRLQMFKAFAPSTITRFASLGADGQILSPTSGYPMITGTSWYERFLYALKINPVDLDKTLAVSTALWDKKNERKAAVSQLGEAFANAYIQGDSQQQTMIARQAMTWGIDTSSVLKSAMIRIHNYQTGAVERGNKPADIAEYQAVLQ